MLGSWALKSTSNLAALGLFATPGVWCTYVYFKFEKNMIFKKDKDIWKFRICKIQTCKIII